MQRLQKLLIQVRRYIQPIKGRLGDKLLTKRARYIAAGTTTALVVIITATCMWPRSMAFAYSGESCVGQFMLFPGFLRGSNTTFDTRFEGGIRLFDYPITATKLCVDAHALPAENNLVNEKLSFMGLVPVKQVSIRAAAYPTPNTELLRSTELPTARPLVLPLDQEDDFFEYRLVAGEKATMCIAIHTDLRCNIAKLGLAQGAKAQLILERHHKETKLHAVFEEEISTLEPLVVTGGSAANGAVIYDQPESLNLTFDKPLRNVDNVKLKERDSDHYIDVMSSIAESSLTITLQEPLKRTTHYELEVMQATSVSDHMLIEPYSASIYVAGGPTVQSHNLKTYGVEVSQNITITFDQPLQAPANLAQHISLKTNGQTLTFTASLSNNIITLNPNSHFASCTTITVDIDNTLANTYGIGGNSSWNHTFRSLCRRTSSIGTSQLGKSILSYWYGNGPSMVIYIGGIHGNERSSVATMSSWLDELEQYADRIPAGRTIVVIPNANPDGYAKDIRLNGRNVDLNRNFPAGDWKPDVTVPGYTNLVGGGGSTPLSESESRAVANFISTHSPRLVLTFHAAASLVSPNGAADSATIAQLYAKTASYSYSSESQTSEVFKYDTTGSLEEWMREQGRANVLVEHTSRTKNEFSKNKNALWAMVNL